MCPKSFTQVSDSLAVTVPDSRVFNDDLENQTINKLVVWNLSDIFSMRWYIQRYTSAYRIFKKTEARHLIKGRPIQTCIPAYLRSSKAAWEILVVHKNSLLKSLILLNEVTPTIHFNSVNHCMQLS